MKYMLKILIGLLVLPLLIATVSGHVFAWDIQDVRVYNQHQEEIQGSPPQPKQQSGARMVIAIELDEQLIAKKARIAISTRYPTREAPGENTNQNNWTGDTKYIRDSKSFWATDVETDPTGATPNTLFYFTNVDPNAGEGTAKVHVSVLANWRYRHEDATYPVSNLAWSWIRNYLPIP